MTKLDKLNQAEHLYVYKKQPLDVIGRKLNLSRRTLFYWKKEYDWDKKRFEKGREQELFNRELLNFAQKIMDKISNTTSRNIFFDEYFKKSTAGKTTNYRDKTKTKVKKGRIFTGRYCKNS